MKKNKKKAFTLAEILITLSIIGVVAALTIPTLIQRTGNEEYVSRLLKAYSTLSQATEAIITENGGVKTWASNIDNVYELYKSHLRNAKDCGSAAGCFKQIKDAGYKFLKYSGNDGKWDANSGTRKLILSDGVQIIFFRVSSECKYNSYGADNECASIHVDINGEKGPNQWGRDVFWFSLKADGLYPMGCSNKDDLCTAENSYGYTCACNVIQEGAMNY